MYKVSIEDKGKTGGKNIKCSNTPPTSSGRQSVANDVGGDIGFVNARRSISEPRDAWEIFFSLDMLSHIIHNTNKKSKICMQNYC